VSNESVQSDRLTWCSDDAEALTAAVRVNARRRSRTSAVRWRIALIYVYKQQQQQYNTSSNLFIPDPQHGAEKKNKKIIIIGKE